MCISCQRNHVFLDVNLFCDMAYAVAEWLLGAVALQSARVLR
jgi:hypothetical protein